MSDTPAVPAASATPEATTAPATPEAPAQETDWKAEARKWEARAKENSEAATKLTAIEEASKTEAQKLADRAAAAEKRVAEFESREQIAKWKTEVAEASGVSAAVLRGSTKEELEAHAVDLKSLIPAETGKKPAIGPYVPPEGSTPSGSLGGPAQAFADYLSSQLGH